MKTGTWLRQLHLYMPAKQKASKLFRYWFVNNSDSHSVSKKLHMCLFGTFQQTCGCSQSISWLELCILPKQTPHQCWKALCSSAHMAATRACLRGLSAAHLSRYPQVHPCSSASESRCQLPAVSGCHLSSAQCPGMLHPHHHKWIISGAGFGHKGCFMTWGCKSHARPSSFMWARDRQKPLKRRAPSPLICDTNLAAGSWGFSPGTLICSPPSSLS